MNRLVYLAIGALCVYSLVLIGIEVSTSQEYVRNFFTDIEGPVPFYAVNTTLSVALLWAAALLFLVGWACSQGLPEGSRRAWFFASQAAVFAWLGLDDRFKIHEHVAWRLDVGDHFVLLVVAAIEMCLLLGLGRAEVTRSPSRWFLLAAASLFLAMIFLDACVPHDMVLRLSLEDLAKTWANVFFCWFAWSLVSAQLHELKASKLRELSAAS